jgi:ABC-2 type transport system permease protein
MFRWRKAFIVTRREYVTRIRTKAFWISTLAVPFLLAAFALGPTLLLARAGGRFHLGVVTADKELFQRLEKNLAKRSGESLASGMQVSLEHIPPQADMGKQREELKKRVLAEELSAVVLVPQHLQGEVKLEYLTPNVTAFRLIAMVDRLFDRTIRELRLAQAGVAAEVQESLLADVKLVPVKLEKGGAEKKESAGGTFAVAYFLMFIVWFTVVMYGMQIMRGVLEEKSSRIVEVIVANLSPMELMFGKILGVGAVGLTQYAIWLLLMMNATLITTAAVLPAAADVLTNPFLMSSFLAFYLLGYFLYGSLYAAIGAAFNSEEEAQQIQNLAGWIMALPFLFFILVMNDPNSLVSRIVSLVPFFAPMLFFLRMILHTPPLWEIILCFALLLITTFLVARLSAAIYKVGILSYGSRPSLRQLWAWARQG